jgi:hypothetical protein
MDNQPPLVYSGLITVAVLLEIIQQNNDSDDDTDKHLLELIQNNAEELSYDKDFIELSELDKATQSSTSTSVRSPEQKAKAVKNKKLVKDFHSSLFGGGSKNIAELLNELRNSINPEERLIQAISLGALDEQVSACSSKEDFIQAHKTLSEQLGRINTEGIKVAYLLGKVVEKYQEKNQDLTWTDLEKDFGWSMTKLRNARTFYRFVKDYPRFLQVNSTSYTAIFKKMKSIKSYLESSRCTIDVQHFWKITEPKKSLNSLNPFFGSSPSSKPMSLNGKVIRKFSRLPSKGGSFLWNRETQLVFHSAEHRVVIGKYNKETNTTNGLSKEDAEVCIALGFSYSQFDEHGRQWTWLERGATTDETVVAHPNLPDIEALNVNDTEEEEEEEHKTHASSPHPKPV